ncbi:MAG: hypothetical protein FWB95_03435 [Treponema sp.]|nr:hypothetical protein [Treponema sp.]
MKRLTISLIIIALIAGSISAQPIKDARSEAAGPQAGNRQERAIRPEAQNLQNQANNVTVEGTLKLEKGFVAVENGDNVYLVPMLNRYIGFIGGLKEGAKVTVEGRGFKNMIQPVKLDIDGKAYDFFVPIHGQQTFKKQSFDNRRDTRHGYGPDRKNFSHGKKHAHDRNGCRGR